MIKFVSAMWLLSGIIASIYFVVDFYRWKRTSGHKMTYNIKLIVKWLAVIFLSQFPIAIAIALLPNYQLELLFMPLAAALVFIVGLAMVLFRLAMPWELWMSIVFWAPTIVFRIYKKRASAIGH